MQPDSKGNSYTILEYSYRDASGYCVYGLALLSGSFNDADKDLVVGKLDGRQFFIPERVGLSPLQKELYTYSGGQPTEDDHPWHEFLGLRDATPEEISSLPTLGYFQDLISNFSGVSDWESWRYSWEYRNFGRI